MKIRWWFGIVILFFVGCKQEVQKTDWQITDLQIVPRPKQIALGKGYFELNEKTCLRYNSFSEEIRIADNLTKAIEEKTLWTIRSADAVRQNVICFALDSLSDIPAEGYRLAITPEKVEFKAKTSAGLFYGLQTFLQLLADTSLYDTKEQLWRLPVLRIEDEPAFAYRGMHLDVSRHFYPVEFIYKYLDLMSYYKFNTFHWHLTDAGGWRLEIRQYPGLVEKGAWRTQEDWRKWWVGGDRKYALKDDPGAYGGYYTEKEIRNIVAYAAERHITVIPEIEMPGQSEEVLHAYPELGCSGDIGDSGEFCAGKEETFAFIEKVLTTVMELFPSEYIHIGGDEASKKHWRKCRYCQERIKKEHLKDEAELQSYFIQRVGKFIHSKGRKLIGWDEILEGGLAEDAIVMSWRGEKGGITAAKSGHDVIMTPGEYCYFDAYQADPVTQPYAIGGFTPYLKVYSYNPVPPELNVQEARHILGAQANVWTEYIATPEHVEYMVFPRMLALSEVLWTPRGKKDSADFKRRVATHIQWLKKRGVCVFKLSDRIDMQAEVDTVRKQINVTFGNEKYRPEIRYTVDGTLPDQNSALYTTPVVIRDSGRIKAALFEGGKRSGYISSARFDYHRAIGKSVVYHTNYSGAYPAAGAGTLTDGYRGGLTYHDGCWQGFLKHIDVTIDMGENMDLGYVSVKFKQLTGPGVYMPRYVKVSVSEDGNHFREVGKVVNDIPDDRPELCFKDFTLHFKEHARYIRLFALKQKGFMFADEIVIY